MAHLTKRAIEAAKVPGSGQIFLRDDSIRGFAVRILPSGSRAFVWEGRVKGRPRRITLGFFPDLSVAAARLRAMAIRTAIGRGENPADERQAERHENTFGELCKRYVEEHSKIHKRSWLRDQRRLERCKAWNARRLSDITTGDMLKLQHGLSEGRGPIEANRTLELLRAVFNKAMKWKMTDSNPALRFERFHEVARDRFLSDGELRRLSAALAQESEPWRSYFPLLLLLGLRRSELAGAAWSDVDLEAGTIRLVRTKTGKPRLAPLPRLAVEILRALPSYGRAEFLFPGTGSTGHLVEVKSAWARICRRGELVGATIHDLRRTCASMMAMAGVNLPTIGRVLGHVNLDATQIYARLDMETARRALDENAARLPIVLPAGAAQ